MEYLTCYECRVPQEKHAQFLSIQWENPRPVCNTCATNRALQLFAADIAACPNAQVIHNHGVKAVPPRATGVLAELSHESVPKKWEREAAKKIKAKLQQSPQVAIQPQALQSTIITTEKNSPTAAPPRWQSHPQWCSGCHEPTSKASRCSQCKMAYFCSISCQKRAWPQHKRDCSASSSYTLKLDATTKSQWMPIMSAIGSKDNAEVTWKALTQVQLWLAEDALNAVAIFRALHGLEFCLGRLKSNHDVLKTDEVATERETEWQIVLLLTRLVSLSPEGKDIARQCLALGGVSALLRLLSSTDLRLAVRFHNS